MSKEKEIGEVFRESFSSYTQKPPAGLWDTIAHDKTLLRFNRRKRWLRAAKISAFPLAGLISVIVISTLFFPKAPENDTVVTTPDQVTTTSSVTVPSPAPLVAESSTSATPSQAPQPSPIKAPIAITQNTDNQQVATEGISIPEPATTAATTREEVSTAPATPKQKESPITNKENEKVVNTPVVPLVIQPEPKAGRSGQLIYSKDTSVCRNSQLTLFVRNAMDVHWNIGVQGESVTIYPEEPILIAATITTFDKIDTTIYIQVGVFDCGLWIPTAFTPNGDGLNDEFIVHAPAAITHYECSIFDRHRGLQFRTNNILQGWDGTANGKPLPLGAYFYIITYFDEAGVKHVEKGQITLIR